MYVRELHVQNVKLLRDFRLSFLRGGKPRMWTVLIGENGLCKTTVLQAIALAASGPDRANQLADVPSLPDKRLKAAFATTLEALFDLTAGHHEKRSYPGLAKRPAKPPRVRSSLSIKPKWKVFDGDSRFDGLKSAKAADNPLRVARAEGLPHWLVAGYGASRIGPTPAASEPDRESVVARLDSLFDRGRPFGAGAAFESDDLLQAFVQSAIAAFRENNVLPGARLGTLTSHRGQKGALTQANDLHFNISAGRAEILLEAPALSQGYQATVAWIADLLYRAIDDAKEPLQPIQMEGLVLIDEIDLHLHPQWQVNLIPSLRRLFPKMQFVVTTHSPMVLPGLARDEVYIMRRTEDGHVVAEMAPESPALMTGSQIYDTFFGLQSLYPNELGDKLRRYGFLVGNPARSDDEDAEMRRLRGELVDHGVDPGWMPVPRGASLEDDDEVIP